MCLFCQAQGQPQSSTGAYSTHRTSTLHRINSVCTALSSTTPPGPSRCGIPSREHVGRKFVDIVSIPRTAACSWSALSLGVQGDTQYSWSFCNRAQTKDRISHTPAHPVEPDLGFAHTYLRFLSSLEENKTKVPLCLASHLGEQICATLNDWQMP